MHAGVLVGPGRERWGSNCRTLTRLTGQGPGRLIPGSAVGQKVDDVAGEAAAPRAPDLRGERVRPPDSAPYLDPSFQNTAPPSLPRTNEDTRSPVSFGHFIPLDTLFYYFCLIKASPRPDVTLTVSVVCSSRHTEYNKIWSAALYFWDLWYFDKEVKKNSIYSK